ncbi:alpha-protein kinase 3 isoform X1 [Arapaima gigas]
MGTRRPLSRSLSGRSASENVEDNTAPPVKPDSRNYLANVRPENRSTLCSVMAQITPETQPLFETTLKSKAVSENCNAKFTCVISGYPEPELTWYKDDMEMDRYCGLPKYEIFRDGMTHTLHIYNCTEEDAAIYQASARNNKGIVTCSGILEVGSMNEYKIHQRFFAKLKQKADSKWRELEESQWWGKENQPVPGSPERIPRKRRSPGRPDPAAPSSPRKIFPGIRPKLHKQEVESAAVVLPNGLPAVPGEPASKDISKEAGKKIVNKDLPSISNNSVGTLPGSPLEEPLAKKKIKITNAAMVQSVGRSAEQRITNPSEGGLSLSQYLAMEVHQSQESEVKQNSRASGVATEVNTDRVKAEQQQAMKISRSPKIKAKTKASVPKEPEPSSAQSLTSVLFSLRDIFFGSKKKNVEEMAHKNTPGLEENYTPTYPEFPNQNAVDAHEEIGKKPKSEQNPVNTELMKTEERSFSSHTVHSNKPPGGFGICSASTEPAAQEVEMLLENEALMAQDLRAQDSSDRCEERKIQSPDSFPVLGLEKPCTDMDGHKQTDERETPVIFELQEDVKLTQMLPPVEEWDSVSAAYSLYSYGQSPLEELAQSMISHDNETAECHAQSVVEGESEVEMKSDVDSSAEGGIQSVFVLSADTMDTMEVKDRNINESAQENKVVTWENTSVIVDRKIEIKEEALLVQQNGMSGLSESSFSPEVKIPSATQMGAVQNDSEMQTSELNTNNVHDPNHTNEEIHNHVLNVAQVEDTIIVPKLNSLKSKLKDVTEPERASVDDVDHRCLQLTAEVSERVVKDTLDVVPPMSPQVKPIIQILQNDLTESTQKKELRTDQQQDQNSSTGSKTAPEEVNCEQITEVDGNSVPFVNISIKDLFLPYGTDLEPSSTTPPLIITATLPCDSEEITDDKKISHSNLIATDTDQRVESETSAEKITLTNPEGSIATQEFDSPRSCFVTLENLVVPKIQVDTFMPGSKEPSTKEMVLPVMLPEISPKLRRKDSLTAIPSATAEELASGARRKIFTPKTKGDDLANTAEVQGRKEESPTGQQIPRSPLVRQKKSTLEVPKHHDMIPGDAPIVKGNNTPAQKEKFNPFKAPQVIRKIRGEPFSDASGHLKLWCQFFNVLSDSTIKWFRDEVQIAEVKISTGDESQLALAIVQASSRDCGVYCCSIENEYGSDSTDFLLSADTLSEFFLKEDLEVGEEVEMTPLVFAKGLADTGFWGNKLFGRIMSEELHVGKSGSRKASRMKTIYGLEPVFESGSTCILKVRSPIAYGVQEENSLTERNLEMTKQDCKIQNMVREYCKIFSAEIRTIENFGPALEVVPLYLMYRPANMVPYATVEANLKGLYIKYCIRDVTGRLVMRTASEVEQKCCAFQHWIHQWTSGNLLVTHLEGVDLKITNVAVVTKSKGYQGLTNGGSPEVFEQFVSLHQCNYYCGLLGLRILKSMESVPQPGKTKASKSPLLSRKMGGMSSPQQQRKGSQSPQTARKGTSSPKVTRKTEQGDGKSVKQKAVEEPKAV